LLAVRNLLLILGDDMTNKVILKFTKAHGVYVPGDVAGFEPVTAERFIAAKVAVKFDKAAHGTGKITGDPGASPELTAALADLNAREVALSKREEALVAAEADRAAVKAGGADSSVAKPGKTDSTVENGAPPKTPASK
jgi:hypothetical protein